MTTTLYFKVTLKTDIILNQKAASEGPNATLDFIPGNNFLGIVAGVLYTEEIDQQKALDLFHNGKVRFGDAHLISPNGARSLKVPASMFYPKLSDASKDLYIHHLTPEKVKNEQQLKQCRDGFYDFTSTNQVAVQVEARKNFAIKSAHDRETRTSKKEKMYGYQSLEADSALCFCVEVDEPSLVGDIKSALTSGGTKRVGRSRSAQFGLVEIKLLDQPYKEVQSQPRKGLDVTIYADSRLIFINKETGMCCFEPTLEQLGVKGGRIAWEKSQIRTFQYAPWNFRRQCFDTDRCGIEKGSVIVIEGCEECPSVSGYVGSYQFEGFGRVIYNPSFLDADPLTGKACWKLPSKNDDDPKDKNKKNEALPAISHEVLSTDSPLVAKLKRTHNQNLQELLIYQTVEKWMSENARLFIDSKFASQWGTIRSIAMRRLIQGQGASSFKTLDEELFLKDKKEKDKKEKDKKDKERKGYLRHGIAEASWEEKDRWAILRNNFLNAEQNGKLVFATESQKCLAIINLAAEMAKLYRGKDKK